MKVYHKNIKHCFSHYLLFIGAFCLSLCAGCEKLLELPLPTNSVTSDGAYATDNAVSAVVTGIFYNMYVQSTTFSGANSFGFQSALYTDELLNLAPGNTAIAPFYTDAIQSANVSQWPALYKIIFQTNIAVEGINSTKAELVYKNQWLGEALFSRAYLYYYLVNFFGDVPLVLQSDFSENNKLGRSPKALVYQQIIADLTQAQGLLSADFKDGYGQTSTVRARPNRQAATALLARVYLETGEWANAEAQASAVIASSAFQMVSPAASFLAGSAETIWALSPVTPGYVREFSLYNNNMPAVLAGTNLPTSYSVSVTLSESLRNSFEAGDSRLTNWVRTSSSADNPSLVYYFPDKYKANVFGTEFCVAFRLAEQYLIRSEARAHQNKLTGASSAASDLNVVRTRAGLGSTPAVAQTDMLDAIAHERRVELFTENGFRFIDLKRTGKIDEIMTIVAPLKGGTWASFKSIWPIPASDLTSNTNLTQAPGYQ